jgi:hypothetical protein
MTMPQDLEQHLAIAEDAAVDLDTRIQAIKQARALMKESEADAALRKRFTHSHSRPVFEAGCRLGDQSECRSPPGARGAGHGPAPTPA